MEFKGTKGSWILTPKINRIIVGKSIADVWGFDAHIDDKSNREMKANALLISKAPEMLGMLLKISKFLKWQSEIDKTDSCKKAYNDIDNLIKQATEI